MKKLLIVLLSAVLLLSCFAGCGAQEAPPDIVVTIFPLYDFVRVILGDNPAGLKIELLQKSGTDLHNYQPSAEDVAMIGMSKLFVYIGGESDEWADAALETANGSGAVCRMAEAVTLLKEETVEGMQAAEEEEEKEGAADEHIWLSLRNAQKMVQRLCDELCSLDAPNADTYRANTAAYIGSLTALDADYAAAVADAEYHTVLVADRFPFRYLTADYGLDYYAAFAGCAASLDVSFETVAFLSEKLKELQLPAVLIIDGSDGAIAQTVLDSAGTDAKILTLHSCQCVSAKELEDGANYLEIMKNNLEILKEALGGCR